MATSVQVLCPNGRRQNVKITPSSTLLQVLEEVCKKQNFLPPEEYNLVHGRNTLDLTLSFRYANLTNNAKLELVKADKPRAESGVLIALQLESGERLQQEFLPSTTLWSILQHWEQDNNNARKGQLCGIDTSHHPPLHPVCIYMREECVGEFTLKETSLKKLGLTGGKAIIRYIRRPVEDLVIAATIQEVERHRAKQARLDEIVLKQQSSESLSRASTSSDTSMQSNTSSDHALVKMSQTNPPGERMDSTPSQSLKVTASVNLPEAMDTEDTGSSVVNSDNQPMRTEITSSEVNRPMGSAVSGTSSAGMGARGALSGGDLSAFENIPGIEIFRPSDFDDLSPQEQEIARRLAQRFMPQLGLVPASQQNTSQPKATAKKKPLQQFPFADFKFPEETKGKNVYKNELSDVNREEFRPCEREAVLYSLDERRSPQPMVQDDDLPDDFFEVTEADVKAMISDYQKKLETSEGQPLMTQAMRRAEFDRRMSKYEQVILRVQFPDRMVLQALFRPRETVFAVQKFVKEYLEDKSTAFYLYTSPPKQVLQDITKTLQEVNLVPATLIYFGSEVQKEHHLSSAVLKEVTTQDAANQVVAKSLPSDSRSSSQTDVTTNQRPGKSTDSTPSTSSGKPGDAKIPKWLMKGKK